MARSRLAPLTPNHAGWTHSNAMTSEWHSHDLPEAGTRTLRVNRDEAETVRHIFTKYCELRSVLALERELTSAGIFSKEYSTRSGKQTGGTPFSRGALFHLLRNRIYLGQIVHHDNVHQGEHEAIIDVELFEAARSSLDPNARRHADWAERRIAKTPLTGKLFDAAGEPMSHSHVARQAAPIATTCRARSRRAVARTRMGLCVVYLPVRPNG